jgi:8-oxo-dGTP pyrophosphatase MutT (NUDIX family)
MKDTGAKKLPRWLEWAREIQALAQTGTRYASNEFQRLRYRRLSEVATEIVSEHADVDREALLHTFHDQRGYATPKVDVRGAVFSEDRLLLVQERADGGWTLPGGWADVGDVPSEAAELEVWEEAGFRVKASKVIGVYDTNRADPMELFHAFKLIFLCDLVSGTATPSLETSRVEFFARDAVPTEFSGQRTGPRHIEHAFAAHEDPGVPTFFD